LIAVTLVSSPAHLLYRGFQIVVIAGDQDFNSINHLIVSLPTAPKAD
jgi:hypothetical protein